MFGCVVNPGAHPSWPRGLEAESSASAAGAVLAYNEALKRTVYMSDFFYPAVIPLASSLPASHVSLQGRYPSTSSDLKFGIDRILGSSNKTSKKDDVPRTEKTSSRSQDRKDAASPTSPRASCVTSSPGRRSPGIPRREGGQLCRQIDSGPAPRTTQQKSCSSPPGINPKFLHDLKFHQPSMRPILHSSPHEIHRHPQDLRSRPPEFLTAQELHGRSFPAYSCPAGSPPAGLVSYHPSMHPVHLGMHYQSPAHHHEYEGSYAMMTTELTSHRSHHVTTTGSVTSQPKRKRSWSRAVFSHLQRKGLEKRFEVQKYVTKPDRKQLAAMLGLTDAQVKVWFQNRRMKWRHAEEAKRKKDETVTDDATTEQTSASDVTHTSPVADACQESDDDELCIDDIDDDDSSDTHDDIITDLSDTAKS